MNELLSTYGYIALAFGIVFQGETALIGAGYLIYTGNFKPEITLVIAIALSTTSGEIYYFTSRYGIKPLLKRFIKNNKYEKALKLIEKYKLPLLLFSRFMYGFRTLIPLAFGMTKVNSIEFSVFNLIGATIWAFTFTSIGYFLGSASEMIAGVKKYQTLISGAVLITIATVSLVQILRFLFKK